MLDLPPSRALKLISNLNLDEVNLATHVSSNASSLVADAKKLIKKKVFV